jgi:hypothetical protein
LSGAPEDEGFYGLEDPLGFLGAPVDVVEGVAEVDEILEAGINELLGHVGEGVDEADPAAFVEGFFLPFFVVAIVGAVEVEDVFADEDKFVDAFRYHVVDDLAFEEHDIVVEAVVPFAEHFHDDEALVVIGVEDFGV